MASFYRSLLLPRRFTVTALHSVFHGGLSSRVQPHADRIFPITTLLLQNVAILPSWKHCAKTNAHFAGLELKLTSHPITRILWRSHQFWWLLGCFLDTVCLQQFSMFLWILSTESGVLEASGCSVGILWINVGNVFFSFVYLMIWWYDMAIENILKHFAEQYSC